MFSKHRKLRRALYSGYSVIELNKTVIEMNKFCSLSAWAQFGGGRGGHAPPLFQPGGTYHILSRPHFANDALTPT